jgi:hypothetical protein
MTDERAAPHLKALAARLKELDSVPDPLWRRVRVLQEVALAIQDTSPTLGQILDDAIDAYRKARIGPAARPIREVLPLVMAAAETTVLVDTGIPLATACARVSKKYGVSAVKLKSFRENLQGGKQSPDTLAVYRRRLAEARYFAKIEERLVEILGPDLAHDLRRMHDTA